MGVARGVILFFLLIGLIGLTGGHAFAASTPKSNSPTAAVAVVLALDGSASITQGDLAFQLQGHAAAFRDPSVGDALSSGGALVTLTVYSGPRTLKTLIPWTLLTSAEDAARFADRIDATPRGFQGDSTAIGGAINDALALFEQKPVKNAAPPRKVIDLVSNGFSNSGPEPQVARDRAAAHGVTVNGLAILDDFSWLEEYFAENVIGGPGAFVKSAMDRGSFIESLRQKLILEMVGIPDHLFSQPMMAERQHSSQRE
jgi:Ca-activated chloride channel homolog